MKQLRKIDMDALWQREQGWNTKRKSGRKYDDAEELHFWETMAPTYSEKFNLYRDVPGLGDWLHEKIGDGQRVMDVGCGSGNFALPMSAYCQDICAIDFSPAMLLVLDEELARRRISNVKTHCCKWEDFHETYEADYVLAVNSMYRMCYMGSALKKITAYGRKGFLIVRTLLKPLLYSLYDDLELVYRHNNDYMLMPMMLWDMGYHAEVNFWHYHRLVRYENLKAAERDMIEDLGELSYLNYDGELKSRFLAQAGRDDQGFTWHSDRIVEVISWFK